MEIIYRKLSELKKLEGNPRRISPDMMKKLKESISHGMDYFEARPLILSDRTGELVILAGNQRYEACKQLGIEEAPTVLLPGLTEEREREIIIRDNVSNGEWNFDILADWSADELESWGVDLPDGWDGDEGGNEASDDDFDETQDVAPRAKKGDVWRLGNHILMCGDSTNGDDVRQLCNGEQCDLLVTDPPYNVAYEGKTKDRMVIDNDRMDDENFRAFLVDAMQNANDSMKGGAAFYIFHADSEGFNFRYAVKAVGWKLRECLIWNKNSMVMGRQDYQWKHEPCLYGWKDGAAHKWYSDRKQTTVLEFDRPNRNGEHPTMKPVPLIAYLIGNSSAKGDVVLDLFGGSGTTLIACEQLGRKCKMMEFDEHYCDVILTRWEKLTSGGGRTYIQKGVA